MDILLAESDRCWNQQPFDEYGATIDRMEGDIEKGSDYVQVHPGRIACVGCFESNQRLCCSAELTQTTVALRGHPVSQQPEASITEAQVPGFRVHKQAA